MSSPSPCSTGAALGLVVADPRFCPICGSARDAGEAACGSCGSRLS
jgi:ribosomal protein S27AE